MRVLIVGMSTSIHVARIVATLKAGGWEVGLFPSSDAAVHEAISGVTVFLPAGGRIYGEHADVDVVQLHGLPARAPRSVGLAQAIMRFQPDLISAQDVQHGGYLASDAVRLLRRPPPLLLMIWGSDLSLRARVPVERRRIIRALAQVDLLTAECERDLWHARRLGYDGETAMAMPVAGGFDLDAAAALREPGSSSARRTITVKGYQHFAGRAQVALRAIELCGTSLAGLRLAVHSAGPNEEILARRTAARTGMELEVVSRTNAWVSHQDMLRMHGRSRISVGLSIADGISSGLLEALVMGSFPIQSDTACVGEWITDGVTGLVVPPEDPVVVAAAIKKAVADDPLVDRAAAINSTLARERLDMSVLDERRLALYARVAGGAIVRARSRTPRG